MKKHRVIVGSGSTKDFFGRVRQHAEMLDRGETMAAEIRITLKTHWNSSAYSPPNACACCSARRTGAQPLAELRPAQPASTRAVHRDVAILENAGLLRTRFQTNPGHGRHKIVEAVAQRYNLSANL